MTTTEERHARARDLVRRAIVAEARAEQRRAHEFAARHLDAAAEALHAGDPASYGLTAVPLAMARASCAALVAGGLEATSRSAADLRDDVSGALALWLGARRRHRNPLCVLAVTSVRDTVLDLDVSDLADSAADADAEHLGLALALVHTWRAEGGGDE